MDRREFLVRATIGGISVPLLVRQIGCDSDDGGGMGPPTGSETFASTPDQTGHTHSITIPNADLDANDARSYTSTATDHSHTVALTAQDLENLGAGCTVTAVSSQSAGHQHLWEMRIDARGSDLTVGSSVDAGHSHTVTVRIDDINNPPAQQTYPSSTDPDGHRHDVILSQTDFQDLQACLEVMVTSESAGGHTHTFTIRRV